MVKRLCGCFPTKRLARSGVEGRRYCSNLLGAVRAEIGAFWGSTGAAARWYSRWCRAAWGGRCNNRVKRVVRSTNVPIAELPRPRMRSPSQWPGTARSASSGGHSLADHDFGRDGGLALTTYVSALCSPASSHENTPTSSSTLDTLPHKTITL
jgi:hypothetical protein